MVQVSEHYVSMEVSLQILQMSVFSPHPHMAFSLCVCGEGEGGGEVICYLL